MDGENGHGAAPPAIIVDRIEHAARVIMNDRRVREVCLRGWLYAATVDHRYLDGRLTPEPVRRVPATRVSPPAGDLEAAAGAELERLAALPDVATLHAAVDELTRRPDAMLRLDSYAFRAAPGWPAAGGSLNVVIIGAGPIGLALASALKRALAARVRVLVVERRVVGPHEKPAYTRHWLTAVAADIVRDVVDDTLWAIFHKLGRPLTSGPGRHLGVSLDVLESLLLLSCRRMGVSFLFGDTACPGLVGGAVDLVFDATGDRLDPAPWPTTLADVQAHESVPLTLLNLDAAEQKTFGVVVDPFARFRKIVLGSHGGTTLPIFMNQILRLAMIKAIRIPIRLYGAILEHVLPRNQDQRFFVWPGRLEDPINEVLLVTSLEPSEYEHLCRSFTYPLRLDEALALPAFRTGVDRRLVELVRLIVELASPAERAQLVFDAPFLFRPRFRDTTAPERFHGKPLIRVGDSVFPGHVKAANGLGPHLANVARLQRVVRGAV